MRFSDFKIINESPEPDIIQALRDFLPLAITELGIARLPKIKFMSHLENEDQPTFGTFSHGGTDATIELNIANRHPVDILRTLAHELVHYKQLVNKQLGQNSGDTGSPAENEAHVVAGVIMRHFDKQYPDYLKSKSVSVNENINEGRVTPNAKDKKLAKSLEDYANKNIPESEPGFGDFMYHAELIRKGHKDVHRQDLNTVQQKYRKIMNDMIKQHLDENMDHDKDEQAVAELKAALVAQKSKLQNKDSDAVYKIIDQLMTRVAKAHGLTGQELHDMWVDKYDEVPDTWIMHENFKDGKNPGRKGLAKRSGVNTKASVSSLRKTAKSSSGEKQRMAHWLANMKSGRKKKKANEAVAPHGTPENEFELMKAGTKPAALVLPDTFLKLYKPVADKLGWPYQQVEIAGRPYDNYIVGQPGEEKRVQRLATLLQDMNANMALGIKPNKHYHIEMGKLLGYSDQDIQDFLKNINLDEEYKDADYARGDAKMPAVNPGRKTHPLHGKLVGGQ